MLTPSLPCVSVVMPVHNAAAFLEETILSIQSQSLTDWELLAVDDGSEDASAAILARFAIKDPRIKLLSTGGNLGAARARNMAMDAARGRWLAFLDADDLWHPEKLACQSAFMARRRAVLSFTAYLRHDVKTDAREGVGVPAQVGHQALLKTNVIGCSTVMLDRSALGGLRMPNLRMRQDYAFWLEIIKAKGEAHGLPIALTTYRVHGNQVSADKRRAAKATWDMYRSHLGLSFPSGCYVFLHYAFRGVVRHRAPRLAVLLGLLARPLLPGSLEAEHWLAEIGQSDTTP